MENKAHNEPRKLSYQLLKNITNDFHEDQLLGSGTFGKVYKGVCENAGEIAVKVLRSLSGPDDKAFHEEFNNLRGLKHPNIVELVGFCNESEEEIVVFDGKKYAAERLHMALCFEYAQNGSLQNRISDANTGFNWHTRYRIIKGICDGLNYLREDHESPVMHFDLKPDNILLDKDMVPKIADFGLSKLFVEENTTKMTNSIGTCGYWPPEYIKYQITSKEYDIFSLGVIIVRIMIGHEGYHLLADMTNQRIVEHVHDIWKKKLCQALSRTLVEVFCNQVKRCIELALDCLKSNRQERPTIQDIVFSLKETETMIGDRGLKIEQFYKKTDGVPTLSTKIIKYSASTSTVHRGASGTKINGQYHPAVQPVAMRFGFLQEITDNFSQERLIGRGGHGDVYKGVYENGRVISVRKIGSSAQNKKYYNCLRVDMRVVPHQNIVQYIGFCEDTQETMTQYDGKLIVDDVATMFVCCDYLPNGSLDKHVSEICSGLDWQTRYRILRGTIEGLRCLQHNGIVHSLLHPSNIFLDENMTPKIADFWDGKGCMPKIGSIEYLAPEFITRQVTRGKSDIYSFGVLIREVMTGGKGQPDIEMVTEEWRKRLQNTVKSRLVEGYCKQVKRLLQISSFCLRPFIRHRPSWREIIDMLKETEIYINDLAVHSKLLDVQPLEICFLPSREPTGNKKATMSSSSCSSLRLNNRGDDRVAFMLVSNNPKRILTKKTLCGVVPPGCAYTLTLTIIMSTEENQLPSVSAITSDNGSDFFTLYSVMLGGFDLLDVGKDYTNKYDSFFKKAKESNDEAVQEVLMKVTMLADQGTSSPSEMIITIPEAQQVSSIDVHPTEPWIMTTNQVGSLRVWDYNTMETCNFFQSVAYKPVHVAKFIAREKWLIAGDQDGCILVYNYLNEEVVSFDAHHSCIRTLVVHPTSPFMLSSSDDEGHLIKLWDWENGWKCTREFGGHNDQVTQVTIDPANNDHFASASLDGTIKIWSICSNEPNSIITLKPAGYVESLLCVDYFTRNNRKHLIVGSKDKTAQIWDLETMQGCVDELEGHADEISIVTLHPELPVLITGSFDGTVRIWNSTTYVPENIMSFNLGSVSAFACIKGSRRIVVGCQQGIATMEIPLP